MEIKSINSGDKKTYLIINILFAAIIFIVCLWDAGSLERIRVVDDGFCYWGIAASISGYDWTDLISASAYYSYGYSIVLVPLFWLHRLGLSMTVIYRAAIVMNACFLSGVYLMALYMIKEFFKELPDALKYIISLFATLYIGNTAQVSLAWTETFLLFSFWCVAVLLYRVIKKPGYINIFALIMALSWMFAIHMRSVGVVAAAVIALFGFFICRRKEIDKKYFIYTLAVAAGFFLLSAVCKSYVMNHIYLGNAAGSANNIQAGVNRVGSLLSIKGILDVVVSFIGKLFYTASATFLLAAVGVVVSLRVLFISFKKKEKSGKREKWQSKEWMTAFFLLSFLAEMGIEAIFQCIPFFRSAASRMQDDTLAFGRYADFIMAPLIILGVWAVYNFKTYYKEIISALLISIGITGFTQVAYYVLSYRQGREKVGFRFAASPWLAMLADGHKVDFASGIMLLSIAILLILCLLRMPKILKWYGFGALLLVLSAVGGIFGIIGGMEYTRSKAEKAKTVDSAVRIVEAAGEETPVYMVGKPNTEVKILQWIMAKRSIHTCALEELDGIDTDNAVILGDSADIQTMAALSDRLDFLYSSGCLSVYAAPENKYYGAMAAKAEEMSHFANPEANNIDLSQIITEYSYVKINGGMYYNYQGTDGAYMIEGMNVSLADGVYEFTIDMRVRECTPDTEIGYIMVGDTDGAIQYKKELYANDFIKKERQNVTATVGVKDWGKPYIGIYTYGNAAIKIGGISYRQTEGNIELKSEEIDDIAKLLKEQNKDEVCYIDSDNSAAVGKPWWNYGELDYLSGAVAVCKEQFKDITYIAEKTDMDVINSLSRLFERLYETDNYIVFEAR